MLCSTQSPYVVQSLCVRVHVGRPLLGEVGLTNLATTSHMNAALQLLRHALPLTKYFLEGRHVRDINDTNTLGCQVCVCVCARLTVCVC